jgi:TrmH family RNA methyltransferase
VASEPLTARNPRLKHLRRLVNRGDVRAQDNVVIAEGPVLVAEALASNRAVLDIYAEADSVASISAAARELRVPVHLVADGALASILGTKAPRPVAAVVENVAFTLDDLAQDGPVLVLVDVRDPGNAGTLIRTAEASGAAGVILAGTSVDPTNPKVIRSSAGASFRLPVLTNLDVPALFSALSGTGRMLAAAVVDTDAQVYDQVDLSRAAIILGNEAHGLSPEVTALATHPVTIPLGGPTESLNVAATGAILCFEALRQRRSMAPDA